MIRLAVRALCCLLFLFPFTTAAEANGLQGLITDASGRPIEKA